MLLSGFRYFTPEEYSISACSVHLFIAVLLALTLIFVILPFPE